MRESHRGCWILMFFALLLGPRLLVAAPAPQPLTGKLLHVIHVKGIINSGTSRFIQRSIDTARRADSAALVVVLDTPGGLLNSTREIVQAFNQSEIPVAVYVAPGGASATSAGTIITMSAHVAAMAPGTNIGAAHPVGGQGEEIKGPMNEKAVNDTVAFIKAQAALRKRNAEWAEDAIRKSVSAPADEALKKNVVDLIADDLQNLIVRMDGRVVELKPGQPRTLQVAGLQTVELEKTAGEKFLTFIGDPNVSYLLMALGGLGIYGEISAPGTVLPGVFGVICLILAFISFSTLPVNYGAVALMVIGLLMFILEIFVTSYGVLTIGGIISLVLGALFLMDASTGDLRLSLAVVMPTVVALGLITAFIGYSMVRSRKSVYRGLTTFEGIEAVVLSVSVDGKSGSCRAHGEIWDFELAEAPAPGSRPMAAGDKLEVTGRHGFKLLARRI